MPKTVNVQILQLCLNYVLGNKNKGYGYCDISMIMKNPSWNICSNESIKLSDKYTITVSAPDMKT